MRGMNENVAIFRASMPTRSLPVNPFYNFEHLVLNKTASAAFKNALLIFAHARNCTESQLQAFYSKCSAENLYECIQTPSEILSLLIIRVTELYAGNFLSNVLWDISNS
jgi:hypothetical protein